MRRTTAVLMLGAWCVPGWLAIASAETNGLTPIAITITNQSDSELNLTITGIGPFSPPLPRVPEPALVPPPIPARPLKAVTNLHPTKAETKARLDEIRSALLARPPTPVVMSNLPPPPKTESLRKQVTVASNKAVVVDLEPGRYGLFVRPDEKGGPDGGIKPLSGSLMVSNSETWIFSAEKDEPLPSQFSAEFVKQHPGIQIRHWKLMVPGRGLALEPSRIVPRPLRTPSDRDPLSDAPRTPEERVLLYEAQRAAAMRTNVPLPRPPLPPQLYSGTNSPSLPK